jgi:hypothetical protein
LAKKRIERGQQGSLFGEIDRRSRERARPKKRASGPDTAAKPRPSEDKWRMPDGGGSTVASVRLSWAKRLSPAQVAQVEAELGALPRMLTNLGFGAVRLEHAFVRRKKGA